MFSIIVSHGTFDYSEAGLLVTSRHDESGVLFALGEETVRRKETHRRSLTGAALDRLIRTMHPAINGSAPFRLP